MNVILTEDLKNKGKAGDLVKVKAGFARNFLIPKGLAVPSTKRYRNQRDDLMKNIAKKREEDKVALTGTASSLNGQTISLEEKVNKGKLYGSVTPSTVAKAISEKLSITIEKSCLEMPDHIKQLGEFSVPVNLHPDLDCTITVAITASEEVDGPTTFDEAVELNPELAEEESSDETGTEDTANSEEVETETTTESQEEETPSEESVVEEITAEATDETDTDPSESTKD